jgi:hypothetical protein
MEFVHVRVTTKSYFQFMFLAWKRKKLEKRELKLSTKFQKRSECRTFCYNAIYIKPEKNTSSKKLHILSGEMYVIRIQVGIRLTKQVTSTFCHNHDHA